MQHTLLAEVQKEKFDGIDMIATGVQTRVKGRTYFVGLALTTVAIQYIYTYSISYIFGTDQSLEKLIQTGDIVHITIEQGVSFGISIFLFTVFSVIIMTMILHTAKEIIQTNLLPKRETILEKTKQTRVSVLVTYIVFSLAIIVLTIAGVIPGIILGIYRSFAHIISCFHPKIRHIHALRESKRIVQNRRRTICTKIVIFGLTRGMSTLFIVTVLTFLYKYMPFIGNTGGNFIIQTIMAMAGTISYIGLVTLYIHYTEKKANT